MDLKEALGKVYKVAKEQYQFENTPTLVLRHDQENANDLLWRIFFNGKNRN